MTRIATLLVVTGIASVALAQDRRPASGCSAIEVTAPGVRKQPRDLRFSTREALDLAFETRLERKVEDGDHVMHFKVLTPSGFLYQDLARPFSSGKPGRRDKHTGPVAALAKPRDGRDSARPSLHARLPVAGTSITMSTLYGRWTVQAFLDDHARPCSPPRIFAIHSK